MLQPVASAPTDVGVIVGRFQVHELHSGHHELITTVTQRHKKVIIFLGVPQTKSTRHHPLDFKSRELMIHEAYPEVTVLPLYDDRDDRVWSKTLDKKIREVWSLGSVTLYGSRDGFAPLYSGQFSVVELEARKRMSGTEIRKQLSNEVISSKAFRHGVIYSAYDRFPTSYTCVDGAVIDFDKQKILLGRKSSDPSGKYRFFGGFVDVTQDPSLEAAVAREVMEEAGGIGVGTPIYVGSGKIDDWRYRNERDGVMSALFIVPYVFGQPKATDDIDDLAWFSFSVLTNSDRIADEHKPFAAILTSHLNRVMNIKFEGEEV